MAKWDLETFNAHLGNKITWGFITARAYANKSAVADEMASMTLSKVINMNAVSEGVRKRLSTEEEPFEGDVPMAEVEADICAMIKGDAKCAYLFDGFNHKTPKEFLEWACGAFGNPSYWLPVTCDKAAADDGWKKANDAEDVAEEAAEEIAGGEAAFAAECEAVNGCLEGISMKIHPTMNASGTKESMCAALKAITCAKIVLVNHDPRLPVDVSCANLAIKYNMLYLSVHQIIKENITKCTSFGLRLVASKEERQLSEAFSQVGVVDA